MNATTILAGVGFIALIIVVSLGVVHYQNTNSPEAESQQTLYTWACQEGCLKAVEITHGSLDGGKVYYDQCSLKCEEKYGG